MSAPEDHFEPEDMPHHLKPGWLHDDVKLAAQRVANNFSDLVWRPIATAPKGVDVIGLFPDGSVRGMWYFAPSSNTFGWCAVGFPAHKANPTHWMPRPAPPVV